MSIEPINPQSIKATQDSYKQHLAQMRAEFNTFLEGFFTNLDAFITNALTIGVEGIALRQLIMSGRYSDQYFFGVAENPWIMVVAKEMLLLPAEHNAPALRSLIYLAGEQSPQFEIFLFAQGKIGPRVAFTELPKGIVCFCKEPTADEGKQAANSWIERIYARQWVWNQAPNYRAWDEPVDEAIIGEYSPTKPFGFKTLT